MTTKTSKNEIKIDIKENYILSLSQQLILLLLKDNTTGRNLIWATDNYEKYGKGYSKNDYIECQYITGSKRGNIIKPRVEKSKEEQQLRIQQKAEVFTPAWICNKQNNLIDNQWFGKGNIFNIEKEKEWITNNEKIVFPKQKGKTWKDYISLNRLEISCGEAPYLTSRYDSTTRIYIQPEDRIGLLDRKLRIINEHTTQKSTWIKYALKAVKSVYGYDWQGDNVFLARENILFTVIEFFEKQFNEKMDILNMVKFARIISWNIFQMDGLKFVIPESCREETIVREDFFNQTTEIIKCLGCKKNDIHKHNGIYCKVMDWKERKVVRFIDLISDAIQSNVVKPKKKHRK